MPSFDIDENYFTVDNHFTIENNCCVSDETIESISNAIDSHIAKVGEASSDEFDDGFVYVDTVGPVEMYLLHKKIAAIVKNITDAAR